MSTNENLQRSCPCKKTVLKKYNWWRKEKRMKRHTKSRKSKIGKNYVNSNKS